MNAKNERPSGAVDQVMFEKVIRDNLSPEGVAAVIAFLRTASVNAPTTEAQRQALTVNHRGEHRASRPDHLGRSPAGGAETLVADGGIGVPVR